MSATDYLRVLRGRWGWVAGAVAAAVVLALVTMPSRQERLAPVEARVTGYSATHTLIQDTSGGQPFGGGLSLNLLAALAERGDIPRRVVERLALEQEPAVVASQVDVTADSELGMITISGSGQDGEATARLVNAFGEEILAYATERMEELRKEALESTRRLVALQRERVEELSAQLANVPPESSRGRLLTVERDALLNAYGNSLSRLQQLSTPLDSPGLVTLSEGFPIPMMSGSGGTGTALAPRGRGPRLLLALIVGSGLGGGAALLLERLDPRIRSRRDAEDAFGLPVVATVPRLGGPRQRTSTSTGQLEVIFDRLRLDLLRRPRWLLTPPSPVGAVGTTEAQQRTFPATNGPPQVILVTSTSRGQGRTTTVARLARSFAAAGSAVLAVDADLSGGDLTAQLAVGHPTDGDRPAAASHDRGVGLLRAAPTDLRPVLRRARERVETVIIDAGPLLETSDVAALVGDVDAVLVVVSLDRTAVADAELAHDQLAALQAPVAGLLLVRVPHRSLEDLLRVRPRRSGKRTRLQHAAAVLTDPEAASAAEDGDAGRGGGEGQPTTNGQDTMAAGGTAAIVPRWSVAPGLEDHAAIAGRGVALALGVSAPWLVAWASRPRGSLLDPVEAAKLSGLWCRLPQGWQAAGGSPPMSAVSVDGNGHSPTVERP